MALSDHPHLPLPSARCPSPASGSAAFYPLVSPRPTQKGGTVGLHAPHPDTAPSLTSTDHQLHPAHPLHAWLPCSPLTDTDTDPVDCQLPSTPRLEIPRTLSYSWDVSMSLSCTSFSFNLLVGGGQGALGKEASFQRR